VAAIAPGRARHTLPPNAGPIRRPNRRSWWPDLIGSTAAASIIIVIALWLRGGNLQSLSGNGALTSLGRLSGLIGADLLLIQIMLIARVPWIERQYGQDRLARWHRVVGFTSINLVLVHVVTITLGYAATDRSSLVTEAVQLVLTYPGMLLATAGTAALVMVAITSVRIARARLRYESWHLLHLYAYVGVGLSLPHELWTGADFVATPLARLYWWGAYIAAAAFIVVYRIGLPLWRTVRHDLRVAAVVPESPGVTSVYLSGRHLHRMRVESGQFFNWRFLGAPGWTRAHPYSLSAAPRPDLLRITVKEFGDGSRDVTTLRPGGRVIAEGPYGRLTGAVRRRRHLTFFACGIGITPIRALLESEFYRPGEAVLIYRATEPAGLTFYRELEQLGRDRGVGIHYLVGPRGDRGSWLPSGHRDDVATLRWLAPDIARSDVYLCGPDGWMDAVVHTLDRIGVPDRHIHLEQFSW
jgi:predicted ferric reductase